MDKNQIFNLFVNVLKSLNDNDEVIFKIKDIMNNQYDYKVDIKYKEENMGAKNYAYINCEMLKWARNQSPIELEDIPIRIKGMKSEDVEKWESGNELPSIIEAKKLCNLYDIPFAALYLTEIPNKDNTSYIDRRTYKDNIDVGISYELWKEINRF